MIRHLSATEKIYKKRVSELRKIRRRKRQGRIEAAKICLEKSQQKGYKTRFEKIKSRGIQKEKNKESLLKIMKDWIGSVGGRHEAKIRSHKNELRIKYQKLIEDWRRKKKFSKDSVINYDAKKKSFKVISGVIGNDKT